jgi:3-hydroxyisobutyrate dehydrogenase
MGGSVAERLIVGGNEVGVFDLDATAIARLVAKGAIEKTLDTVGDCEILITSLPNDEAVRSTLLDSTILDSDGPKVLMEISTILPETMTQVAEYASQHGLMVVDAPVSGGPNEALAGTLTLLVGADDNAVNAARSVLEQLGTIERVGMPGHGKATKLVNNTMSMGNMAVAVEAFTLGIKLGLEPHQLFEVLSRSGGRSHHFEKRMPYALDRDFKARFAVSLCEKDLRLALKVAGDADYAMPICNSVYEIYELASAKGLANEDMVAIIKVYEEWARI